MNLKKITLSIVLLTPLSLTSQIYIPTKYEDFLTKKIESIRKQQKTLASKLAKYKDRAEQEAKKLISQGNQSVLESLTGLRTHLDQKLKNFEEEKSKLRTLSIKDEAEEKSIIRKTELRENIGDLNQQIKDAQRNEQFFEIQKKGKSDLEIKSFDKIKQSWAKKREQLAEKIRRAQSELQNLK